MKCYALTANDDSVWRRKIESESEHFCDVSALQVQSLSIFNMLGRVVFYLFFTALTRILGYLVQKLSSCRFMKRFFVFARVFLTRTVTWRG